MQLPLYLQVRPTYSTWGTVRGATFVATSRRPTKPLGLLVKVSLRIPDTAFTTETTLNIDVPASPVRVVDVENLG